MGAVIAADSIVKRFPAGRGRGKQAEIHALRDVSIHVDEGEIVGLVGESGSGKSTLSRILVGIEEPTAGTVLLRGEEVRAPADWKRLRGDVQYVFQDPYESLPPTMNVKDILVDPLAIRSIGTRTDRVERAARLLELVGLRRADLARYPAQFSGGQRQRISLARALILQPEVIICDEVVSGLDVSVQAQVLNLLLDLHERLGVGYLFISHDLRVVRYLSDRVAVMYKGQIVEEGPVEDIFLRPQHPYTKGLLNLIPDHTRMDGGATPRNGRNDGSSSSTAQGHHNDGKEV
jgi:ABC-type oligopeptide transport system ATPase subunit